MHKVDTGRLTTLDYARIDDTVGARCADLVRLAHTAYRLEYDTMSLTRLAHHSIGCTAADLRDCELDAIDAQVDFLIEFYA